MAGTRPTLLLVLCVTMLFSTSYAQFAQRSRISGFVTDSSGAFVANATVTLKNIDRNQPVTTHTDETGRYEFTELTFGAYQVSVEQSGFKKAESPVLNLNASTGTRYDVQLVTGAVTETVVVTNEQPLVDAENASVAESFGETQVQNLPLNGRNFTSIASLLPAVSTSPRSNVNSGGTYDVGAMFAAGGTQYYAGGVVEGSRDNGYYINGVNINENYQGSISYQPSAEAIGEVRVGVSEFSAAVGHDVSTFNVSTKGGTNLFHGSVYDYIENDAFNALNPYDKLQALSQGLQPVKPFLRRNQFGGTFGGPVRIPKVVNLKDKAFFFVSYERFPERDGGGQQFALVPSDAERSGDFSELLAQGNQLYNPYTTSFLPDGTYTRDPIAGNRLDLATKPGGGPLIDPSADGLLALWPQANTNPSASNPNNYVYSVQNGFTTYHLDTRFDYKLASNNSLFVTWSKYHGTNDNHGGVFPRLISNNDDRASLITVNDAHIFTPSLTNEFIFAIGNGALVTADANTLSFLNGDDNPFNSLFQNTGSGLTRGVLAVNVFGYASPGFNEIFRAENQTLQFSDNLNWIKGKHSLTFGMNYFRKGEFDWDFIRFVTFGEGSFVNQGGNPVQFTSAGSADGNAGGDAMADLLLGLPQVIHQRFQFGGGNDPLAPELDVVFPYWGFYVNDKIQISKKFTLTAGLRYDLNIPLYARNKLCCAVYEADANGGLMNIPGISPDLGQHYLSAAKNNFAPRLSFAYQVTPRTVLRGGYGIYNDSGASQISGTLGNAINGIPGYFIGDEQLNSAGPPFKTLADTFQPEPQLAAGEYPVTTGPGQGHFGDGVFQTVYYFDQKSVATPYYQRFLLDVQRELSGNSALTVSYLGALGRKSPYYADINVPAYQTGWASFDDFNAARPNNSGRFGDIYVQRPGSNTSYHAGVVKYQRRFSRGLELLTHYTLSKTISDRGLTGQFTVPGFNYPQDILRNRGEASLSHRHRFVISGVWEPQYGKTWPTAVRTIATGWRFSTIATMESGDTLTPMNLETSSNDFAATVMAYEQLNVTGNPNLSHGDRTFSRYFNTDAFSVPANNVRGNAGPGIIRGPGQNNWDISLGKTFSWHERLHAEIRGDFFNAFNHTQWNSVSVKFPVDPDTNIPFGQVQGAREGRIIQLSAKISF